MGTQNIDLLAAARHQRRLIIAVIVLSAANTMVPLLAPRFGQVSIATITLAVWAIAVVFAACTLVMLRRALGGGWVFSVLLALLAPFSCLGVLVVVVVDGRASSRLKKAGLRVGLLGVPPRELAKLRHDTCLACAYDLSATPSGRCPECGWEFGWVSGRVMPQHEIAAAGWTIDPDPPAPATLTPAQS